jgi:hypothetical protein
VKTHFAGLAIFWSREQSFISLLVMVMELRDADSVILLSTNH